MVLREPKFKVPTTNCFTVLRSLRLDDVCICNENSRSGTLVLSFPILETFEISKCKWFPLKFVEIYAPTLIKFSYHKQNYSDQFDQHTINIHGDRLAEVASGGCRPEDIFVTGSNVVCADFCYDFYSNVEAMSAGGSRIRRLLKEFSCTLDQLILSFTSAKAISKSSQGVSLTSFAKLRRLSLRNPGNTTILLELLHAMPCLKCLSLCVSHWFEYDYEAVESIPSCIESCLEKIKFVDINYDLMPLYRLARFLLKTALCLKEFHDSPMKVADYFAEKISAYPTGSTGVTITGS